MALKTKVGKLSANHPLYREGYEHTAVCECGWVSFGWPTKKQATERHDAHAQEHKNAPKIRELLDAGDVKAAQKLMMPPKEETEAKTPDKFPVDVRDATEDDVNGVWDQVS
jgi:hypothetical protein